MTPQLSVIVPCHNEEAHLEEALDVLAAEKWDGEWEIVVVDNNSTDGTRAIAERYAARGVNLRVVAANEGSGVSFARNAGVAASDADLLAFCDGDDVVEPGWVEAMAEALEDADLVAGVVDASKINDQWLASSRGDQGHGRLPTLGSVTFARGNNVGMRRWVWAALDGFDEEFVGLEDIEFSLRARRLGVEPVLVPGAVVHYRYRSDLRAVWRQGLYYGTGQPALEELAKEIGLKGRGRIGGLRSWLWLAVHLPRLRNRTGRFQWVWVLANRVGVLQGSIRERLFYV